MPEWAGGGMMRRSGAVFLGILGLAGLDCRNSIQPPQPAVSAVRDPYCQEGSWTLGNFHMHSTHSDGAYSGAELVQLYRLRGYGVLCISDHNQYGDQDGGLHPAIQSDNVVHDWNGDGVTHPEHVPGSGVEAYVREWSVPPVEWLKDEWYLPELLQRQEAQVLLPGAEASLGGWHIGLIGYPATWIEPPRGSTAFIGRTRDAGGFIFLAHPGEWNGKGIGLASSLDMNAFHGLEIANGLRLTKGEAWDATPLWDELLGMGYRMWGMGNDDAHTTSDTREAQPFTAFNVVLTSEATREGYLQALHRGSFYASTGVFFSHLGIVGDEIVVEAPLADEISFIGAGGARLQVSAASSAKYSLRGDETYVRVEARQQGSTTCAWSQPFFVAGTPCGPTATKPGPGFAADFLAETGCRCSGPSR